jgi:serine/threonine protein kinase
MKREALVWRPLQHPNILPFLGICEDDDIDWLPSLISPYCEKESLEKYITDDNLDRLSIVSKAYLICGTV